MIDWDDIEARWRVGTESNVKIAAAHKISEGAIRKRAKAEGWVRGEPMRQKKKLPDLPAPAKEPPVSKPVDEPTTERLLEISSALAMRMLDELDSTTSHLGELEELINSETEDDRDGRRRSAMIRAISLSQRSLTLKTLVQALTAAQDNQKPAGKKEAAKVAAAAIAKKFTAATPPKLTAVK